MTTDIGLGESQRVAQAISLESQPFSHSQAWKPQINRWAKALELGTPGGPFQPCAV